MIFVDTGAWVDEVLTVLKTRFRGQATLRAGLAAFVLVDIWHASDRAWLRKNSDKQRSFTDRTSFAIIERLKIARAFAYDKHFTQMRGIERVPD